MTSHLYLTKANDDLISHCDCAGPSAAISFPQQVACPWCGCGWLFGCMRCSKAFTFARAVAVDESWESLAHRALVSFANNEPEPSSVAHTADLLRYLHVDVVEGVDYVWLDGVFVRADAESVHFDGWHARHDFDFVPQRAALSDRRVIERVLANPDYWAKNELPPPVLH